MTYNNRTTVLNDSSSYSNEVYTIACNYIGRDYNRHIGQYIIDELLQRMSDEDATEFLSYANLLVLIDHGMFSSTVNYLKTLSFSGSLENIRLWLIEVLSSSDSVEA